MYNVFWTIASARRDNEQASRDDFWSFFAILDVSLFVMTLHCVVQALLSSISNVAFSLASLFSRNEDSNHWWNALLSILLIALNLSKLCVRDATKKHASSFAQTTSLYSRDLAYYLNAMWAKERELIATRDCVNLRDRVFIFNFYVRERTTLFKRFNLMFVHLLLNL